MRSRSAAVFVLSLGLMQAAPFTANSGGPTAIVNNSTVTADIVVSDTRTIIGGFSVSLNTFSHSWMGDLNATITHVDTSTTTFLFNRPGALPASSGGGCNDDFGGTYTFSDSAGTDLRTACFATNGLVAPGSYLASQDIGGNDETPILIAAIFNGQSAAGTWRLAIQDTYQFDAGSLGSWTLNLELQDEQSGIPEPATYAISALGLIAIAALRRKR